MSDQERNNLSVHEDCSTSYSFVAATDYAAAPHVVIPAKAKHTIYVIRLTLQVTTDDAALQTWLDGLLGTPIAAVPSAPGIGSIDFDFNQNGFALTEGNPLVHSMDAAGMAGAVTITAYYRKTS